VRGKGLCGLWSPGHMMTARKQVDPFMDCLQ
jgi:hypothetical protein